MSTIAIPAEIETKSLTLAETARTVMVSSEADYAQGAEILRALAQAKDEVRKAFRPVIEAAHVAHKKALAQEKTYLAPIECAYTVLTGVMGKFRSEQERVRLEAYRLAEAERSAAQRQADEDLRTAMQTAIEEADFMGSAVVPVVSVAVVAEIPAEIAAKPVTAGVTEKWLTKFRITGVYALAQAALATGKQTPNEERPPAAVIAIDERVVREWVNDYGEALTWPGVKVNRELSVSGRR